MAEPHYFRETVSSTLHAYTNAPQDLIRQGFGPSNYACIKQLPARLKQLTIRKPLRRESAPRATKSVGPPPRLEWMPDSYNNPKTHASKERQDKEAKRRQISPSELRSPGVVKKGKHEQGFAEAPHAFVSVNDPFYAVTDQINRLKWIRDCHVLGGTFRPALKRRVPPPRLAELITAVKKKLEEDWNDANFELGLNPRNMLEVRFEVDSVESSEALAAYMNVLAKTEAALLNFGLTKDTTIWGTLRKGYLVFQFKFKGTKSRQPTFNKSTNANSPFSSLASFRSSVPRPSWLRTR